MIDEENEQILREMLREALALLEEMFRQKGEEVTAMVGLLEVAREGLLAAGPCEISANKCAMHGFNPWPCEVSEALRKLAGEATEA